MSKAERYKNKHKFYKQKTLGIEQFTKSNEKFVNLMENSSIYVDTTKLIKGIYQLIFSMPKKDRVVLGEKLFESCLNAMSYFQTAYTFKEKRVKYIDKYLFEFNKIITMLRLADSLKRIEQKQYVLLFEIIENIDNAIIAYRKSSIEE